MTLPLCSTPRWKKDIQLIRNVLKTQNQLIREIINPDVRQVPRQIVFFSQTEEFFTAARKRQA